MNETFAPEPQLIHAYELVFQVLLYGLIVAVALVFIAAIVLIILCCRDLKRATRRRDAELAKAYDALLKSSGNDIAQRHRQRPADINPVRSSLPVHEPIAGASRERRIWLA